MTAADPDEPGRFLRPGMTELPRSAVIPEGNLLDPAPDRLTHEIVRDEPYYYYGPAASAAAPDGVFPAGTKVLLVEQDARGERCKVADARGLCVEVSCAGLRPL